MLRLSIKNTRVLTMVKRKASAKKVSDSKHTSIPPVHNFTEEEVTDVRKELLTWYDENKRDLPWRARSQEPDSNQRAYAVWVSEIMLQQTQVATVIDYYNRWMQKWPTLEALASSTLEEVNEMWSGLGYYSRGRRLHEGANKVVTELGGQMPKDAESLLRDLPGVGKYTAGAIASIAYNQRTGLVDGNVIRVLCRMRLIGADSTSNQVTEVLWQHANSLVDPARPGDFNQSLMELGATVCTPKNPSCNTCPVNNNCKAWHQVKQQKNQAVGKLTDRAQNNNNKNDTEIADIECLLEGCHLCLPDGEPYDSSMAVMNYPRKGKKKAAREERTQVCVLCRLNEGKEEMEEYFIVQRPDKGLLAGLWEFPSHLMNEGETYSTTTPLQKYGLSVDDGTQSVDAGEVVHIFSHIHQTYVVKGFVVNQSACHVTEENQSDHSQQRWVTKQQFLEAAVSTAMKKVFKAFEAARKGKQKEVKKPNKSPGADKNQRSISSFFKPK